MGISARNKRLALQQLGRDRLAELTTRFEVEVADRRAGEAHVDALIGSRKLDFAVLLGVLKREELQAICDALGVDRSGREKEALVTRILATNGNGKNGGEVAEGSAPSFALTSPSPKEKRKQNPPRRAASSSGEGGVADYRHDDTRKNNPPAGLIEFDRPPPEPTKTYAYDPHLDPTLQWTGKAERTSFEIDTVSLHIHESVSTQAILRAVKREEVQGNLFARFELPESKEIQFYQHEVGWRNRLILGDSLLVMNSLIEREHMAGKVQCVYVDPPYGVKFNSNFQPSISRRDVKDGDDASLTREPEQIQAYRDTWTLGIHSYLTYMRDRLLLARELLAETGSIFVQISDENVHHVRELLDEVFGPDNFCGQIAFAKTTGATARGLPATLDYVLWYGRQAETVKYRQLYLDKKFGQEGAEKYDQVELPDGSRRALTAGERANPRSLPGGARFFTLGDMTSQSIGREKGIGAASWFPVKLDGREFLPTAQSRWKTNEDGMRRLLAARRVQVQGNSLRYVRFIDDFPAYPLSNLWEDIGGIQSRSDPKVYVVQTATTAVQRCMLMTTDPGDLVFDPTCGSGTTAYVAEQWGRRWITCDTSRVALALARQRLLTARYPFYRLRSDRVRDGFHYRTVPHITLKSIAQNQRIDDCKTQSDRERAIRESADQEVLHDQPDLDNSRVRVSGPFTVEAIPTATLEIGESNEHGRPAPAPSPTTDAAGEYLGMMIDLVKKTGIQFANGRSLPLPMLRPVRGPYEYLHAEADSGTNGGAKRVAVSFGPQHAPVTPGQVLGGINETRGYDIVIFVGFACDPEARRIIDAGVHGRELQFANAAPDILVKDLLKTTKTTKLFTVFGSPDAKVHPEKEDLVSVELVGIDIYDPNTGETRHSNGEDVAAWFVDHDYDSRTFCVCQALFPGGGAKNPWEKLQKALKGTIDEEKFEALRSTRSLPFKPGKKIAVKVIDDRGNEVIKLVEAKARGRGKGAG
jgi:adenine-specific DNA-methyltransferase